MKLSQLWVSATVCIGVLGGCAPAAFDFEAATDAEKTEYLRDKAIKFARSEAISGKDIMGNKRGMIAMTGQSLPNTEVTTFRAQHARRRIEMTVKTSMLSGDYFAGIGSEIGGPSARKTAQMRKNKQIRACKAYSETVFSDLGYALIVRHTDGQRLLPGQISVNAGTCRRVLA